MTAAIESLHAQFPGKYHTAVESSCPPIFEHNPHVRKLDHVDQTINMTYPLISRADKQPAHFLQGFTTHLGNILRIKLVCSVKRPYVYLSQDEMTWVNQVAQHEGYKGRFWLINAGHKNCYTIKKWHQDHWQAVVDKLQGRIQFVQVGEQQHNHTPLNGVINLIGKTDLRQMIRLAYHADGAITPESFLHHLMAAYGKPCVTLCSGFLPTSWIKYHTGTILTHQEKMSCCDEGKSCWKARVVPLGDGDRKDDSVCLLPVIIGGDALARCMDMITPTQVVDAVLSYYAGGRLSPLS